MDTVGKSLIGVLLAFVLIGVYAYLERGRTLECRANAQQNGVAVTEIVSLCKN
jgi:hypothetical protein